MKSMFRRPGDSNSSSEEDTEASSSAASQESSSLSPTVSGGLQPDLPAAAAPNPPILNPVALYSPLHPSIPSLPQNHHVTLLISSLLESHISSRISDNPTLAEQLYIDVARQLSDFGITPKNSELFARGELASVRQNYVEGIDTLLQQGLQKKNDENRGGCAAASLVGDKRLSLVRRNSNKPTLRRMMTDLPGGGRSMDERKVIHRSSSLSILANATKSTKYRPNTAPALAESPPSFFPVEPPAEPTQAQMSIILKPSRYSTEFIELGFLGRGGFGSVYHVRNRLDGAEYAIKKVVLKNEMFRKIQDGGIMAFEKVVKEVNTMAKLEHGNIVRYYGSWIDGLVAEQLIAPVVPVEVDVGSGVLGGTEIFAGAPNNEELPHNPDRADMSDGGIVFQYSDEGDSRVQTLDSITGSKSLSNDVKARNGSNSMDNDNSEDEESSGDSVEWIPRSYPPGAELRKNDPTSPRSPGGKAKVVFNLASSSSSSSSSSSEISESGLFSAGNGALIRSTPRQYERRHQKTSSGPVVTLHIQMSLHKLGLTAFLSSPHPSDSTFKHCFCLASALELFLGLVNGVAYLHAKGIVHRDLKPGNIFLDTFDGRKQCKCIGYPDIAVVPRIGDFGLVKDIEEAGTNRGGHSTTTVGTEFYRPPPGMIEEDIVGRDLFALGVILVELVFKFDTRMERVKTLTALTRSGELPVGFDERLARVVRGCCGIGPHFQNRWDIKKVQEAVMHIAVG